MDALALDLFEKARKAKISVTRDVIRSFGRSAKTTLLKASTTSADVRERLNDFKAGERWAKNFVKRNGLHSSKRLGEAGSVDTEAIEDEIEEIRALCAKFPARRIFNVDETGIQWKVMPRRTYLSNSENRKTARGSKGMTFKDRLSARLLQRRWYSKRGAGHHRKGKGTPLPPRRRVRSPLLLTGECLV